MIYVHTKYVCESVCDRHTICVCVIYIHTICVCVIYMHTVCVCVDVDVAIYTENPEEDTMHPAV